MSINRKIPRSRSENKNFPTTSGQIIIDWSEWQQIPNQASNENLLFITATSNVHVHSWAILLVSIPFLILSRFTQFAEFVEHNLVKLKY